MAAVAGQLGALRGDHPGGGAPRSRQASATRRPPARAPRRARGRLAGLTERLDAAQAGACGTRMRRSRPTGRRWTRAAAARTAETGTRSCLRTRKERAKGRPRARGVPWKARPATSRPPATGCAGAAGTRAAVRRTSPDGPSPRRHRRRAAHPAAETAGAPRRALTPSRRFAKGDLAAVRRGSTGTGGPERPHRRPAPGRDRACGAQARDRATHHAAVGRTRHRSRGARRGFRSAPAGAAVVPEPRGPPSPRHSSARRRRSAPARRTRGCANSAGSIPLALEVCRARGAPCLPHQADGGLEVLPARPARIVKEVDARSSRSSPSVHDTAAQFERVFDRLSGWEGRLTLTDPDDMLTTGIEVGTRPPGKKIGSSRCCRVGAVARGRGAARRDLQGQPSRSISWMRSRRPSTTPTSVGCSRCSRSCAIPAVDRHHPPEADDGDRGRVVWRVDARGRRDLTTVVSQRLREVDESA